MRNLWFSLRESWIKRQNCIGDVGTSLLQYPQFICLLFKSKKKGFKRCTCFIVSVKAKNLKKNTFL